MKYVKKVKSEELVELEEKEKYFKAITLLLNEMETNLKRANRKTGGDSTLEEIYKSVSYLGTIQNIELDTQKILLEYLKTKREIFKKRFNGL